MKGLGEYLSDDTARPRCRGLQFNDLAALAAGAKRVIYTSVQGAEDSRLLDELCAGLKLVRLDLAERRNAYGEPVADVLIGTGARKLAAAKKAYAEVLSPEWGAALGYPDCCVRSYIAWSARRDRDLVLHILAASPRGRTFPFWMNNVYNYYSRLTGPADRKNFEAFSRLNRDMDREAVVCWHPCSYLCAETVRKGRLIYGVLERYIPRVAALRREVLSRPVLFWDMFRFAPLDGRCAKAGGGFRVPHTGPGRPQSLLGPAATRLLRGPGELKVAVNGKVTGPGGRPLPGSPAFLPFSA